MRVNANTTITGQRVVLVPYRREHVPRYHEWMQSEELQELTASEPLSLAEEYAMCDAWRDDADKITFILLDRGAPAAEEQAGWPPGGRAGAMAGDVNAFVNDPDDRAAVELEVMVAEPASRRRGLALEGLRLFMAYLATTLGVTSFTAKIGQDNAPSIELFTQRLGFRELRRVEVFREVHFELRAEGEVAAALAAEGAQLLLGSYD
ncbi:N-acetyltransferase [Raphidocelis subcapitata]|uniref:N-acetyltransferase n=1 Tax=Raphidocelis subcapitata TaxID=307507 RepID=A0A2V0P207_9CHLO|nr:N-acetyltransferase [Raphidocelis subcapitata]|eukprot:GBF93906.1 N-acetyltransferase [Raphidocelis subcapitata]